MEITKAGLEERIKLLENQMSELREQFLHQSGMVAGAIQNCKALIDELELKEKEEGDAESNSVL